MSLQFLDRIIAVQNANWIGWQRFISGSTTLSTFTVAVLISVIDVFLFLIFAAKIIDSIASEKLRIGLEEDEDLAVLQRIEKLKGQRFVIDKELDWMEPVHDVENENNTDDETTKPRLSLLSYVFPLREVCHSAKSPAFGLLDRDTHASYEDNFQAAQVQKILSRFDEICGPTAFSFKRFWILRGVILRFLLLKLYFDLSWIAPFTRYDQFRSRASRLTLKLGLLGTSFWATMAFYSFKSKDVGVVADSNALSLLDLLIYNVLAVIFQQIILVFITQLIVNASETSFRYRFPFVYAEMQRRQASELRFSAMTPEELEEALREAQALQDAAAASLKNISSIEQVGKDTLTVIEAVAEEHVTSTEARLLAAEQEAEAKSAAAAKKKMTPLLAKAARSILTQRPSHADLLTAAAVPFLLGNPIIVIEPLSTNVLLSVTDEEKLGDPSKGFEKSGEDVSKVISSVIEESSSELSSIDRDDDKVVEQQNSSTSVVIPPAPPQTSYLCCSTCYRRFICGCTCFRRLALKNSSSAVDAVRAAQKRAAQIAIDAEFKASKLFEEAEREARLFFAKRGFPLLTPFALQFLVFLVFSFFVMYWILFSLAQGDAIIIEESSNWLYWTIVLGPLITEPCLFLVSILWQLVIWPSWQPYLASLPDPLGRLIQSNGTDPNVPNRKKKKGKGVGGESLTRAAGLASSFPPALAALAFAVTAAASSAVTAASNSVVNAATTSAAETAADDIADAEEDAKKIAEEEERKHEEEAKKHEEDVEAEEKKKKAEEEERRHKSKRDNNGDILSVDSTGVPALDTESSKLKIKPQSTHRKLKPNPVVTPEMRDLLIIKASVAIKVQAAEKVAQTMAADSSNIVDDNMLKKKRQERMREQNESNLMRLEDKNSLMLERFRRERDYQKRREDEERMLEVQISEKSEKKDQCDELICASQQTIEEQERLRRFEEEKRLLEEKENLLRLLEEEKEQEHRLADDVAEQQLRQEEREKRVEEIRIQNLKEKEMLEAQLEMEDEEAAKGLIGEIEGGEDELVEDEIGVEAGDGVASRRASFHDLT